MDLPWKDDNIWTRMRKKTWQKKRPPIVCIGGMPQSGSTLLLNLMRIFCETCQLNVAVALSQDYCEYHTKEPPAPVDILIVKEHMAQVVCDFLITVRRDIRDTTASALRKRREHHGNVELSQEEFENIVKEHLMWHTESKIKDFSSIQQYVDNETMPDINKYIKRYEWCYEDYKVDPLETLKTLMRNFFPEIDTMKEEVLKSIIMKAEGIKDDTNNLLTSGDWDDPRYSATLMLKEHITSNNGKVGGYKETLTDEQIAFIETECGPWLRHYGYLDD
jgi:hypothetical protein